MCSTESFQMLKYNKKLNFIIVFVSHVSPVFLSLLYKYSNTNEDVKLTCGKVNTTRAYWNNSHFVFICNLVTELTQDQKFKLNDIWTWNFERYC
jgi:hypothetical protein